MTSRDDDGRLPALHASCLAAVAAALDEIGAKWMITGAAAHALLDLAPWPHDGRLTLITSQFAPSRLTPSFRSEVIWTGGTGRWLIWAAEGSLLLAVSNSVGRLDEASFERTTQSNGLRIAPPEYLLVHSASQGNKALASAISKRFEIDWAFVDEAMAREWDHWEPVALTMQQVLRQVRNGSPSV